MNEELAFDVNDLKLGELCDFEEATGVNAYAEFASGQPSAKALVGIIWLLKRRENPEFTFKDAGELRMGDINFGASE